MEKKCPNRDYECQYCGEKGKYAEITKVHDKVCEKKIISCPNAECKDKIMRKDIDDHVDKCKYSVIPCQYESIGCGVKRKREEIEAHEKDDQLHLHMAIDTTIQLKKQLDILAKRQCTQEATSLRMTEYQQHKNEDENFIFPFFYSSPRGYCMTLDVYANGNNDGENTHVSVFINILKGKYDKELKWPFIGAITITLLNQLEDSNHRCRILHMDNEENVQVGDCWGYTKFIFHSELSHDPVKSTQYLKDDTVHFNVSVEVRCHKPWLAN